MNDRPLLPLVLFAGLVMLADAMAQREGTARDATPPANAPMEASEKAQQARDAERDAHPKHAGRTPADQQFLDHALASGLKEVATARLARERAKDDEIRRLATLLERDHLALNAALEAAGGKAPAIPQDARRPPGSDAAADDAALLASDPHMKPLLDLRGEAFDKAYLAMTVRMHQASIARFEAVTRGNGHGEATKALAGDALPTLRRHAEVAASIKESRAVE